MAVRAQQGRAQRRGQHDRHQHRQRHRRDNRGRELAVDNAGGAAHEGHRHEHRRQHQADAHGNAGQQHGIGHRLPADAAEGADVAHLRHAHDQRREDQRHDQHEDQVEEQSRRRGGDVVHYTLGTALQTLDAAAQGMHGGTSSCRQQLLSYAGFLEK
ncbi:hypothetical protein G6F40_015231 [Rhizopus arrhizus]|nr:hypothetical protein G6F40_015231 [Rhizopus arrhizus]